MRIRCVVNPVGRLLNAARARLDKPASKPAHDVNARVGVENPAARTHARVLSDAEPPFVSKPSDESFHRPVTRNTENLESSPVT